MRTWLRRCIFLLLGILPCATQSCGLMLLSEDEELQLGLEAYPEALKEFPEIKGGAQVAMLQRVMQRIVPHTGRTDYAWEVRLLDAKDVVNAWCLPGGKMAFYTGILPICKNEDGIAAVMGHEISHALLHHANQRISQQQIVGGVLGAVDILLSSDPKDAETKELVMGALGAGATVGLMLPYSRGHESEADALGVELAIQAGYDPWEAVRLWERMAQLSGGQGGPEFLSTHPDSGRRAKDLAEMIPKLQAKHGKKSGP